jgi:hypothetical protein
MKAWLFKAPCEPDQLARIIASTGPLDSGDAEVARAALRVLLGGGEARKASGSRSLEVRNDIIREAAERFFPNGSCVEKANRLHFELARYAATSWLRDRTSDECPHSGLRGHLWRILKVRDHVPSARQLRRVLALSKGVQMASG